MGLLGESPVILAYSAIGSHIVVFAFHHLPLSYSWPPPRMEGRDRVRLSPIGAVLLVHRLE